MDPVDLCGVQVDRNKFPPLQRNTDVPKDRTHVLPKPVVVTVRIDGQPMQALFDSGSLGGFMSSNLADQLKVKREELENPMVLQLAVQGSRLKVNTQAKVKLEYQSISEDRHFDIIDINSYDLILGTPFMYQHQVCIGFNPAWVVIGSDVSWPIKQGPDTKFMFMSIPEQSDDIEAAREELRHYAEPLCRNVHKTELPPL